MHSAVAAAPMIVTTIANKATIINIKCSGNIFPTSDVHVDSLCTQIDTHIIRQMQNAYMHIYNVLYQQSVLNVI